MTPSILLKTQQAKIDIDNLRTNLTSTTSLASGSIDPISIIDKRKEFNKECAIQNDCIYPLNFSIDDKQKDYFSMPPLKLPTPLAESLWKENKTSKVLSQQVTKGGTQTSALHMLQYKEN